MGMQSADSIGKYSNMARFSLVVVCAVVGLVAHSGNMVEGMPRVNQNRLAPSPLDLFRDDLTLLNLTDAELAEFFSNEEAVTEFAKCVSEGVKRCRSSVGARRLLNQIQSLGAGGKCEKCNPAQQDRVEMLVFKFIMTFQMKYPTLFQKVLPKIVRFII